MNAIPPLNILQEYALQKYGELKRLDVLKSVWSFQSYYRKVETQGASTGIWQEKLDKWIRRKLRKQIQETQRRMHRLNENETLF